MAGLESQSRLGEREQSRLRPSWEVAPRAEYLHLENPSARHEQLTCFQCKVECRTAHVPIKRFASLVEEIMRRRFNKIKRMTIEKH